MSPESEQLESFFAPAHEHGPPGLESLPRTDTEDDFVEFFEKLSSIDDMPWFSNEEDNGGASPASKQSVSADSAPAAHPRPNGAERLAEARTKTRKPAPQPAAESAGQVFRSSAASKVSRSEPRRSGTPRSASAPASSRVRRQETGAQRPVSQARPTQAAQDAPARRMLRHAGRGIAITVLGTALFATGLGMGALILSLPKPTDSGFTDNKPSRQPTAAASAVQATQPDAVSAEANGPSGATEVKIRAPEVILADAPDFVPNGTSEPKPATPKPAATPVPANTPHSEFGLQVGACGSHECVQQFRNLLLQHVTSTQIQLDGGSGGLQRVRVAPLTREAATALKHDLSATDPRFAQAYLVSLR